MGVRWLEGERGSCIWAKQMGYYLPGAFDHDTTSVKVNYCMCWCVCVHVCVCGCVIDVCIKRMCMLGVYRRCSHGRGGGI